jgi:hypothetical protein
MLGHADRRSGYRAADGQNRIELFTVGGGQWCADVIVLVLYGLGRAFNFALFAAALGLVCKLLT